MTLQLLVLLVAATIPGDAADAPSQTESGPSRLLMSVGINEYEHLGAGAKLYGAVNDVDMMVKTLEPLGFQPVSVLKNSEANGDAIRAGWDNVLGTLDNRPDDAPPAWVFFHYSGHGSVVRDQEAGHADHDEKDGYDETLVPADALPHDPEADIRDDELYHFAEKVTKGGRAKLFLFLDCCHSGSGARGEAPFRLYRRRGFEFPPATKVFDSRTLPEGSILLSACAAMESVPEYHFARDKEGNLKEHGLLTFFFNRVMENTPIRSRLSNQNLRDAIEHSYFDDRWVYAPPTPQIEASPQTLLDETFLDLGPSADREPYFIVDPEGENAGWLDAGILQRVTEESKYEVYGKAQDANAASEAGVDPIAWLEIESVVGPKSKVKAIRDPQQPDTEKSDAPEAVAWPDQFTRGYAVLKIRMPGALDLRVKVVHVRRGNDDDWYESQSKPLGIDDLPPAIRRVFMRPDGAQQDGVKTMDDLEKDWVTLITEQDGNADLILRYSGGFASVFPALGSAQGQKGQKLRSLAPLCLRNGYGRTDGPVDLRDSQASEQLRNICARILRARNLQRLSSAGNSRELAQKVSVKLVKVEQVREGGEPSKWQPWPVETTGARETPAGLGPSEYLPMRNEEMFALEITNNAGMNVYVTAANVAPKQQILVMYPRQPGGRRFAENVLTPGATVISQVIRCTPPFGNQSIAYLVTAQPHNFTLVEQEGLPTVRSGTSESIVLPPQRGPLEQQPANPGGGSLGQALMSELGFRNEKVGIAVGDPSWAGDLIRFSSVEGRPRAEE